MKAIEKDKLKTQHFELNYPQNKSSVNCSCLTAFFIILAIGQKYLSYTVLLQYEEMKSEI